MNARLALKALGSVAGGLPIVGPVAGAAVTLLEFVLEQHDAWSAVEAQHEILAKRAAVDAKAEAAFGPAADSSPLPDGYHR